MSSDMEHLSLKINAHGQEKQMSQIKASLKHNFLLRIFLIPLLITTATFSEIAKCEKFKVGSDIWSPFFLFSENKYSGIACEVIIEIARRTGDTIELIYLPNKRAMQMFQRKELDIIPLDSPTWNDPDKKDTFVFTDFIMEVKEYIYFHKSKYRDIKKPADLKDKTVHILAGYKYPFFEEAFRTGLVKKEESFSEKELLELLNFRRTEVIFMDEYAFGYSVKQNGFNISNFKRGKQLSNAKVGVKIRAEKAHILPRFNRAISDMKRDGTIKRIINKYIK